MFSQILEKAGLIKSNAQFLTKYKHINIFPEKDFQHNTESYTLQFHEKSLIAEMSV